MIKSSDAYKKAIVADARRIAVSAIVRIVDPDLKYGETTASSLSKYSNLEELHNEIIEEPPAIATLEKNRWLLNGKFDIYKDNPVPPQVKGYLSEEISDARGVFRNAVVLEMKFSNVSVLQAFSVNFPKNDYDGVPATFKVEVLQGGTVYFSRVVRNKNQGRISFTGFTVYNPDAIRITVKQTSIPYRRFRCVEITVGIFENWNEDIFSEISVKMQGDVSNVSLPFGTCTFKMDNLDRRFEPRNKTGIFESLEERQGVKVSFGVQLPDGSFDYKQIGEFYQYEDGWKTSENDIMMQWDMVDIVGLLEGREYIAPAVLPTTLEGWVQSLVGQLGDAFKDKYIVDPNYKDIPLTCTKEDIDGETCGDIIRHIAQASGTWCRADASTGKLTFEPLWNEGDKITLDNLSRYPVMKENDSVAAIIFNTPSKAKYVVSGNSTTASKTVTIDNPFIRSEEVALMIARQILSTYGGNKIQITGRGNMASEIGDVDTVWLDESSATTARRVLQNFTFSNGVMKNLSSTLVQADGSFMFTEKVIITENGTWTAPVGVTEIRFILIGNGADGADGTDGSFSDSGENGADGDGGKVFSETITINPQQNFNISFSAGNAMLNDYTSANGKIFPYGYTDIASGDSYARTGVEKPLPNSGDGGKGGKAGRQGRRREVEVKDENEETHSETVVDEYPSRGGKGVKGATGCVVIYYPKVGETIV